MKNLKYLIIIALIALIGCKDTKNEPSEPIETTSPETEVVTEPATSEDTEPSVVISEDQIYYAGTWLGTKSDIMVDLSIENNGLFTVKECADLKGDRGIMYKAKFEDGKVIGLVNPKDFTNAVVPSFDFTSVNADTLVMTSGLGKTYFTKTDRMMPKVNYIEVPKDNEN